jgi:hypothetical protein
MMMDGNAEICCAGGALGMEESNRIVRSWSGNCVRLSLLLRRLVDAAQRWLLLVSVGHVGNSFAADRNMMIYSTNVDNYSEGFKLFLSQTNNKPSSRH